MWLLYKDKAIGRHGKGQKEKPIIITTWAVRESYDTKVVHQESADQASQNGFSCRNQFSILFSIELVKIFLVFLDFFNSGGGGIFASF